MTRRAVLEHTKIHYPLGAGTDHSLIIIVAPVPGHGQRPFVAMSASPARRVPRLASTAYPSSHEGGARGEVALPPIAPRPLSGSAHCPDQPRLGF
jgi:hypothetical protein